MYSSFQPIETLTSNYEEQIIRTIGRGCYKILLDASDANTINQIYFLEIARQLDPSIAGNVTRHLRRTGGYDGGPSMKYLLCLWYEKMPEDVSIDRIIQILRSNDICLNALAYELATSRLQSTSQSTGTRETQSTSWSIGARKNPLTLPVETVVSQPVDLQGGRNGLIQELECPVCMELMLPPAHIWQCAANHLICEDCKCKMSTSLCPTCRHHNIIGRAYTVENIAAKLAPVEGTATERKSSYTRESAPPGMVESSYNRESAPPGMAPPSVQSTTLGAVENRTSSTKMLRGYSASKKVPRNTLFDMSASRSSQKAASISSKLSKSETKRGVHPIEQLLTQAEPLFAAFRDGRAGPSDMRNICEQMKIEGASNLSIYSTDGQMKEVIKTWYMREGRSVANIQTLIEILLDVSLGSISQAIIENVV